MKILHIETGRFFYGGPQQVLYLCSGLKNLGFKNILVCSLESDLGKIAKEQGIRVIEVRCKGDLDIFFALRLSKIINNECPDIIHCHSRRGADFLGGMVAYWYGIPAILSRRVDSLESNLINKLRNILFLKTIAISKNIYNILSLSGIKSDQLSLIRSAVDSTRFMKSKTKEEFLDRFNLNENDFVYHAGTKKIENKIYSNGGRVINFVSLSSNFKESRDKIFNHINKLNWNGGFFRKDIGYRVIDE